ncbi:MAG: glycine zipper 2TM domain-containing protein [Caldiserica bacterium]|nr:glycine zipper 2TM domain-containing protein [Caldisericota bacterium]
MKRFLYISLLGMLALGLSGCATMSPRTKAGAKIGGLIGAVGGAAIDKENPWRGAVEGAAAGALIGGAIGNIVDTAAKEAAEQNHTVIYQRKTAEGGWEKVIAEPTGKSTGNYKLISIKYIKDGKVVKEEIKKVPY